jgi:hypothetical protein
MVIRSVTSVTTVTTLLKEGREVSGERFEVIPRTPLS